jgi:hypothetical protein
MNGVLPVRILAVQPQALDSLELEDNDGFPLTGEVSSRVRSRAHVPCMNPKDGHRIAIDNDREDFPVVK